MSSLSIKASKNNIQESSHIVETERPTGYEVALKIKSFVESSLKVSDLSELFNSEQFKLLKQFEPTQDEKVQLFENPLKEMEEKAKDIFKTENPPSEATLFTSNEFIELLSKGFLGITASLIKKSEELPLNIIADCGVCEAVFSHALAGKPILATDSLATCVGVAGYNIESKSGFVIHFATESDLEASKDMLFEKIIEMSKNSINKSIELHLRGGIKGLSEPLVEAIEKWVESSSEKGCPMTISSKQVLMKGLFNNKTEIPNMESITLDTRDGSINTYDRKQNPYAKKKLQVNNSEELDHIITEFAIAAVIYKPGIKITYFGAS